MSITDIYVPRITTTISQAKQAWVDTAEPRAAAKLMARLHRFVRDRGSPTDLADARRRALASPGIIWVGGSRRFVAAHGAVWADAAAAVGDADDAAAAVLDSIYASALREWFVSQNNTPFTDVEDTIIPHSQMWRTQ